MPQAEINGVPIHYQLHGQAAETIVFAHGLLWSERIFDDQVAAFQERYRCITFDYRGHGQTAVTRSGYDIETLYGDTVGLLERLRAVPCHFVGLSMGGIVGLRIGVRRPELLSSLALIATSADAETNEKKRRYRLLTTAARLFGLGIVADRALPFLFGKTFLTDPARANLRQRWRQAFIANRRFGAARAVIGVMNRKPFYDEIDRITVPTLVAMGEEDASISKERAERIHARIGGSRIAFIPRAGHTPTVEEPAAVNTLLEQFFSAIAAQKQQG